VPTVESSPPSALDRVDLVAAPPRLSTLDPGGRPLDWPAPGEPIDLPRHDPPHASSLTEWWYTNVHLRLADGREQSLFAAFFRIVVGKDEATHDPIYAHSVTWAISDPGTRRFVFDTVVDRSSPRIGLERLARAEASAQRGLAGSSGPDKDARGAARDPRVRAALREMLERGQVPLPDHMFTRTPYCAATRLELDFDGNRFERLDDGSYRLSVFHEHTKDGVELVLAPVPGKGPVRHGDDGVVRGPDGADMFYYFVPRLAVTGTAIVRGTRLPVVSGEGWYDHEFGGGNAPIAQGAVGPEDIAWNWCALQLDDGSELTAYTMTDMTNGESLGRRVVRVDAHGLRHEHVDFELAPLGEWRSTRTFNSYPTAWRLTVPELALELHVTADFPDQEIVTLISKPAFWEGRCHVSGTLGDLALTGRGYVERSGYLAIDDLESFFTAVGKEVRRSVAALLPYEPTWDEVRDLVASESRAHYMEGVDVESFVRLGVTPVREITDRGGKGWRSYAALACCDVVGGDSREFAHWLAMPELMHVGSLIVDDVQDRSFVRRGGPACHVVHGEALAINAGTACYFMGQNLLQGTQVSDAKKLRLYDLYFGAMRAGHAGQAFDIGGLDRYMPDAIASGDTRDIEGKLLAVHRLKTAAPAGLLARMGAIVGGGSEAQIEGLGRFFEALGVAFQMVDDVLNLRGFAGELKLRGEDLAHGKVTLPVVKALSRLDLAGRTRLWDGIRAKHQDQSEIDALVALIDEAGGLEETERQAAELVERAWVAVDPLLEPSVVKLMLRAFGWFVLQRHY